MSKFLPELSKQIHSEVIREVIDKNYASIIPVWIPLQLTWVNNVYRTFHVYGVCIINQALHSKKNDNSEMSKGFYLEKYMWGDQKSETGVNAMSISDITGIPRATVIRKLNKLIKEKFLKVDNKKHYSSTGHHAQKLLEVQKITLDKLSKFATRVYNLCLTKKD